VASVDVRVSTVIHRPLTGATSPARTGRATPSPRCTSCPSKTGGSTATSTSRRVRPAPPQLTPAPGEFLVLPSGGTLHAEIACNKQRTTFGGTLYDNATEFPDFACHPADKIAWHAGSNHAWDRWPEYDLTKLSDVRGTAIAIAYKADVHDIAPEDFVVVSTNQSSPWLRGVDYPLPPLPACPAGGCHCMWGWVHSANSGQGENYMIGFRCTVSAPADLPPLPKPKVARKCPFDRGNCTAGAKSPHFWFQAERNNNHQAEIDPPYYNWEYGFADGAQTDLYEADGEHDDGWWAPPSRSTSTMANPAVGTPAPDPNNPKPASVSTRTYADTTLPPVTFASDKGGIRSVAPSDYPSPPVPRFAPATLTGKYAAWQSQQPSGTPPAEVNNLVAEASATAPAKPGRCRRPRRL
jgi:hypothetical protein